MDTVITSWGLYYPSERQTLRELFVTLQGSLLDLGSGLGDVVEVAYRCGLDAHGIEGSEALVAGTKCPDRITHGDYLRSKLAGWDYLYYFLLGCNREKELFEKLKAEATGRIILTRFNVPETNLTEACKALNLKVERTFPNGCIGVIARES